MNFAQLALNNGGCIRPLIIPIEELNGPAITNPSVLIYKNKILVNLRNINYTLYHSELNRFEHIWGPLSYVHPENDNHLRTTNYIAELNENLDIVSCLKIDTSKFDNYEPQWDFVGLEDVRLVEWDGILYGIGVRRDLDNIGTGRMEISEFEISNTHIKEVFRYRVPGPEPDDEYCMKNCTPILDKPFHLLKWTNPTNLMTFDPFKRENNTYVYETSPYIPGYNDMRGGSQIIPYADGYLTIIHETEMCSSERGKKDGIYRHRFIVWDKNFKIKKISSLFSFLNMKIEFCCGIAEYYNDFLITFGAQDNTGYILKISKSLVWEFIYE